MCTGRLSGHGALAVPGTLGAFRKGWRFRRGENNKVGKKSSGSLARSRRVGKCAADDVNGGQSDSGQPAEKDVEHRLACERSLTRQAPGVETGHPHIVIGPRKHPAWDYSFHKANPSESVTGSEEQRDVSVSLLRKICQGLIASCPAWLIVVPPPFRLCVPARQLGEQGGEAPSRRLRTQGPPTVATDAI